MDQIEKEEEVVVVVEEEEEEEEEEVRVTTLFGVRERDKTD